MPEIIPLELTFNESGGDATFHDSLDYTPPANKLILFFEYVVQVPLTPPPTIPLVVGNGVTWVLAATQLFDHGGTDRARLSIFRGLATAPTFGKTRTSYAQSQLRFAKTIYQFSNVDIGAAGANAIVQVKNGPKIAQNVTSTPSVTLDNPGEDVANSSVGILAYGDTDTARNPLLVPGLGWAFLRNNPTAETGGQAVMFRQQVTELNDWSAEDSGYDWAPMALELRNAVPGPPPPAEQILGRPAFLTGNLITPG